MLLQSKVDVCTEVIDSALYGYYYANDAWVMRKHAELLTMANIDFLMQTKERLCKPVHDAHAAVHTAADIARGLYAHLVDDLLDVKDIRIAVPHF